MRIFISHASEDKADFVRPLAEALKRHYQVWYDEYELVVGNSLLQKIDEGLRACDYGVVVLSPSFFKNKWPRSELDGLFALETTTRKIILPVWKDVSHENVIQFSPILAGRLATLASEGMEKVVNDLRKAIEVSSRAREISASDSVIQKAKLLDQTLQERANAEYLSRCEEGVRFVKQGFDEIYAVIDNALTEIRKTSKRMSLEASYQPNFAFGPELTVRTHAHLEMHARLSGLGGNYTYEATVICEVYRRKTGYNQFQRESHDRIRELKFKPTFNLSNQVLWIESSNRQMHTTDELAA